ncbi:mannose-1-phosphate guanylyltransferase/mannose-6-phosphate isomerase [Thiomicrospira microaerophila]|uniref:mannose-1-phosphate guanylyltransferase/mannose-6-phosphate isomerase n=1 Tax=Thiomicrospira microaerophila TaxID=406020 RepID=UPI0005CA3548|nr:mannose-1-phosphate guanylyltransferase/mannose-6-phosphate isomerase [Thiomicrospira microaerophila]
MINILLSGGSGTRLWPLSRTKLPKQFVRLFDNQSLYQKTLERNAPLCHSTLVVTNTEQYFLALDHLQETYASLNTPSHLTPHTSRFLLEPIGRNTAPAIALACLTLDPDDIVFVTTSDHLVKDQAAYENAVNQAKTLAEQGYLVTFGIQPTYPETGFGYIEANGNNVKSFKEKPNLATAQSYLTANTSPLTNGTSPIYLWNSGMFCFKAGTFLTELKKHSPEIHQACEQALSFTPHASHLTQREAIRIPHDLMQKIPEDSIDYAVMEKSDKVKVIPCDMGWSDLGSFDALYDETKTNEQPNAVLLRGQNAQQPISIDSQNNLIVARDRQIALIDVEDLLVIDTSDAILISKKDSSQKVKQVVSEIKKHKPELAEIHRVAHRPWGTYEVLVDTEGYKVKRIVVKPNGRLSLQKHYHRNEHWIVVSGTATVTVDQETKLVRPNESTYIKMGQVHRLENDGKIDLVMIEVQVGEYTGEDDIVRIEDIYARN